MLRSLYDNGSPLYSRVKLSIRSFCFILLNVLEAWKRETLLGFHPSLTKEATNGDYSDIKHANSKNDANSIFQNTALKRTFDIYSLNISGLLSHIDELRVFIDDQKPDIICINETMIDDEIHDSNIEVDDYLLVRKDRNSEGRGVSIYILKTLEGRFDNLQLKKCCHST